MIQKWKVYCATEKLFIFSDGLEKPRVCPHDENHEIIPLYTTAVITRDDVKEIRFSPLLAINEKVVGQSPVWEKLSGFQISPAAIKFKLLSVAIAPSSLSGSDEGNFSVRLYEPSTSHTLAEVSTLSSEKKESGSISTLITTDFQPPKEKSSQLYLEIHISASSDMNVQKNIQEILLQWK